MRRKFFCSNCKQFEAIIVSTQREKKIYSCPICGKIIQIGLDRSKSPFSITLKKGHPLWDNGELKLAII